MTDNLEHHHEDVFGKSFALYGKQEMLEFIEPFEIRFQRNQIDPNVLFAGKNCLDAGSGNGRGAIFMMSHGASSVDCLDISQTNIESIDRNMKSFGFYDFRTHIGSIENLPFDTESFDFVWCNGVIMHAANPDGCLKELARVMKIGGQGWLYVYGSSGLYWWMVARFRQMLRAVPAAECLAKLQLMRYPVRYVAEYMDDWKVPYLRTYTIADLGDRLIELCLDGQLLKYGVDYDTSHRRTLFPRDIPWLGEGDLRYVLTKTGQSQGETKRLDDGEYGSALHFDAAIEARFGDLLDEIATLTSNDSTLILAACAHIQKDLRDIMTRPGELNLPAIEASVRNVLTLLRATA